MKYIILFALIVCALSTTKKEPPAQVADIYKGIKSKIYKCVADSEKASAALKELANKNLNLQESQPLNFHSIELTNDDRHVIRECKREAFIKRISRGNEQGAVTPIAVENAVHSKKFVKGKARKIRKLSETGALGAFSINGIFSCIENAQPGIKVIRDTVNLIKSMDYTGALLNVYDNFSAISEGLSYCFNSIFPSD